jgi:hypothetical protein
VVSRNYHPGIPRGAAFATALSGCDAEFALRVDPRCLSKCAQEFFLGAPQHAKVASRNPTSLPFQAGERQRADLFYVDVL